MKVLAFGTFDILHKGHEHFLKSAKDLGDELIVVVARDKTVREVKKHTPKNNEEYRKEIIEKLEYVDEVFLGSEDEDKYQIIEKIRPDIIALGYDQNSYSKNLMDELFRRGLTRIRIIRLQSYKPEIYKSSKMR